MTAVEHRTTVTADQPRTATRWAPPIIAGVVAGPLFVTVIVIQALSHSGFELAEHPLSLLALGDRGWIQTTNFIFCGAAYMAAALTERRTTKRLTAWTRRMIVAYGAAVIVAGIFPADPWHGYPIGADETTTWHGVLHNTAAAAAGLALVVATITAARAARNHGRTRWATASVVIGVGYLVVSMIAGATRDLRVAFAAGAVVWCWASSALARTQIQHPTNEPSATPYSASP